MNRSAPLLSCLLVACVLMSCCANEPKGHVGVGQPVFEYTVGFIQDARGRWVPSPKTGAILAVTRPHVPEGVKVKSGGGHETGAAPPPPPPPPQQQQQQQQQLHLTSASIELLEYAMFKGTNNDCGFGVGETGSYLYISGRRWPRQRKHWVDTTCDATTVIIQEIDHLDGSHTDRVYLLYDGRPSTEPPSQVTVELVNNPGVRVVLTCGSVGQECFTETSNGMTLSPSTPLHPSGIMASTSAAMEAFVQCVQNQSSLNGITDALKWQISGGAY